jgi:hypothetical protein
MTTSAGNTYAWLLELGRAGYFRQATRCFQEAISIVDGLAQRGSESLPHRIAEADIASAPSGTDAGVQSSLGLAPSVDGDGQ